MIDENLKEQLKEKSIEKMKMLKLHKNVIDDFITEDKLNKSETRMGILYWLNDEEEQMVKDFEEKNNCLVYHLIKTETNEMGIIYDLLYVTIDDEDLVDDNNEVLCGRVLSHTVSEFSESGYISVKNVNGGLIRRY